MDSNPDDIGEKLAKLIEENVEMFVQLEHLARGTDPQDVREGHVKLMSQIIRCRDALWNNFYGITFDTIMVIINILSIDKLVQTCLIRDKFDNNIIILSRLEK